MDRRLKKWEIAGAIITIIAGTLLHYVYQWSGGNAVVGIFGAVNESVWEHLKLLFWPVLIFSIVEYFAIGKRFVSYIPAKAFSLSLGLVFLVMFFYTYKGIIGKDILFMDILDFVLGVLIIYCTSYRLIIRRRLQSGGAIIAAIAIIIVVALCLIVFTFNPPHIPLFQDPQTMAYGIPK